MNRTGWILAALSFVLTIGLLLFVRANNPSYAVDYLQNPNPDARHYVLLGENFLSKGEYSRQEAPPYMPDVLRTPIYPLLSGLVVVSTGVIWPLYVLQALCAAMTVVVVFDMGRRHFSSTVARVAATIVACDMMLSVLALQAMTESLFVLLSTFATSLWIRALTTKECGQPRDAVRAEVILGVLVGIAILVRPAAQYLPALFAVGLIVSHPRVWVRAVALVLGTMLILGPWIIRNQLVFNLPKLTNADTINLLYFSAASVYQIEDGLEREAAQARIAEEFKVPTVHQTNNPWLSPLDVADMDRRQRAAAKEIILGHKLSVAKAIVIGTAKSLVSHNTADLAEISALRWSPPGLSRVLEGDLAGATGFLRQNHPFLIVVFLWELFIALFSLSMAMVGSLRGAVNRNGAVLALGGVAAYFLATVAVVGIDAYSRHRAPIVPLLALLAGYGWDWLFSRGKR